MARQQVQQQSLLQSQPAARQTGGLGSPQVSQKVPQELLDLSKFSASLTEYVQEAQADANEQARAQGQADAQLGRPWGSGVKLNAADEANRKSFQKAQESGEILPTDNPWYRVGMLEGEARRVMLNAWDVLNKPEAYQDLTRPYDENGNLRVMPDIDQKVDEVFAQLTTDNPSLQTYYGRNVASDMAADIRAKYHSAIGKERDTQLQQYHEENVTTQMTRMLEMTFKETGDYSPEGMARLGQSLAGLEDFRKEILVKRGIPDPGKVMRLSAKNFIAKAASSGADDGLRALELVRSVKIGQTTVEGDASPEGVAFREWMNTEEIAFQNRADTQATRDIQQMDRENVLAIRNFEVEVSKMFDTAIRQNPGSDLLDVRSRALDMANMNRSGLGDEFRKTVKQLYAENTEQLQSNPKVLEEYSTKLLDGASAEELRDFIDMQREADGLTSTDAIKLLGDLDTKHAAWMKNPIVVDNMQSTEKVARAAFTGYSNEAQAKFAAEVEEKLVEMRATLSSEIAPGAPPEVVEKTVASATQSVRDWLATRQAEVLAKEQEVIKAAKTANGMGISHQPELDAAFYGSGTLSQQQYERLSNENLDATDTSKYLGRRSVEMAVGQFRSSAAALGQGAPTEEEMIQVMNVARSDMLTYVLENRNKFTDEGAFRLAFDEHVATTILPAMLGVKKTDTSEGRKGVRSSADRVADRTASSIEEARTKADAQMSGHDYVSGLVAVGKHGGNLSPVAARHLKDSTAPVSSAIEKVVKNFGSNPSEVETGGRMALAEIVTVQGDGTLDDATRMKRKQSLLAVAELSPDALLRGRADIQLRDGLAYEFDRAAYEATANKKYAQRIENAKKVEAIRPTLSRLSRGVMHGTGKPAAPVLREDSSSLNVETTRAIIKRNLDPKSISYAGANSESELRAALGVLDEIQATMTLGVTSLDLTGIAQPARFGATIEIEHALVNPWKQKMFRNQSEIEAWEAQRPEQLRRLANMYGVDDVDFDSWKRNQKIIATSANLQK